MSLSHRSRSGSLAILVVWFAASALIPMHSTVATAKCRAFGDTSSRRRSISRNSHSRYSGVPNRRTVPSTRRS